jgi:DNA-binding IclR family transcriptional regulator
MTHRTAEPRTHAPRAETAQTLDRGLRTLELLAGADRALSVAEIAATLGLSRTVTYRLVATLEEHRLARRDQAGRVRAGLGLLHLTNGINRVLRAAALPVLRALSNDVGATAHLTVADGDEALAVAVVEPSWTDYHVAYRVGARHPLNRGAAGRAILLGRKPAGRGSGYVSSEGELEAGAYGIAAPLRAKRGLEASLGVVAMSALDGPRVGPRVRQAAEELAHLLG